VTQFARRHVGKQVARIFPKLKVGGQGSDIGKALEIFQADDHIFEPRFDSCIPGILERPFESRFDTGNRCKG